MIKQFYQTYFLCFGLVHGPLYRNEIGRNFLHLIIAVVFHALLDLRSVGTQGSSGEDPRPLFLRLSFVRGPLE